MMDDLLLLHTQRCGVHAQLHAKHYSDLQLTMKLQGIACF
jgi:hypothetical protein